MLSDFLGNVLVGSGALATAHKRRRERRRGYTSFLRFARRTVGSLPIRLATHCVWVLSAIFSARAFRSFRGALSREPNQETAFLRSFSKVSDGLLSSPDRLGGLLQKLHNVAVAHTVTASVKILI